MKHIDVNKNRDDQWDVAFITPDRHSGNDFYIPMFKIYEDNGIFTNIGSEYDHVTNKFIETKYGWGVSLESALTTGLLAYSQVRITHVPQMANEPCSQPHRPQQIAAYEQHKIAVAEAKNDYGWGTAVHMAMDEIPDDMGPGD